MFCDFYLLQNCTIDKNSTTTQAKGKISTDLESLEFKKFFNVGLTKLENYQILPNHFSHRFLVTTKLFGQ